MMTERATLRELEGKFKGKPAFIMAGSPVLPAHLALMPDDAVTFSCNWRPAELLKEQGLDHLLDFVIFFDRKTREQPTAEVPIADKLEGLTWTCARLSPFEDLTDFLFLDDIPAKPGSTGIGALLAAELMGCDPIILAGFDCYTSDRSYFDAPKGWKGKAHNNGPRAERILWSKAVNWLRDGGTMARVRVCPLADGSHPLSDLFTIYEAEDMALKQEDPLTIQERAKYDRVYELPNYGKHSPGARMVEAAIEGMAIQPGSTIYDFGVGSGKAAERFVCMGHKVTGFDIAEGCLDPELEGRFDFEVACLWELELGGKATYGFCCDVMEHIPPARVRATLERIAASVEAGCFFQIATGPDSYGARIGEVLHMTVANLEFWEARLAEVFADVEVVEETPHHVVLIGWHWT